MNSHSTIGAKKTLDAMNATAKKARSIALQMVAILSISFAMTEIALRIYNRISPSYLFENESRNKQFRGKPFALDGSFKLNSLGFKDQEFLPKAQNGYRIVALGDSFAFGVVHYENNYLTLIESALRQNHPNTDLLNMGIIGTRPQDYYELLIDEGLAFKPNLVLVSFFIGNDFTGPRRRRLYEYSYLATLVYRLSKILRGYQGAVISPGDPHYCDDCPSMTEERYLKVAKGRSAKYVKGNKRFIKSLDAALVSVEKIREVCRSQGIALVVVLIPDELQVNGELQKVVRRQFHAGVDAGQWDSSLPNRTLANRLAQLGIDHIDLYDAFAAASSQQRLYKPRDTHWNIAGNRLAASLIADQLKKYLK